MKTFLYVPNLIGYGRIALLILAYLFYTTNFAIFVSCYFLSFVLDAVDGIAARALNQCSKFGACLDMLIDRMATLVLAIINLQIPNAPLQSFILWWIIIDLTSHWLQTLAAAQSNAHHKSMANKFGLLNLYYTNKVFMCTLCVGAEVFLLFNIYMATHSGVGNVCWVGYVLSLALFSTKGFIHILQLLSNVLKIVEEEEAEGNKLESSRKVTANAK
jgi:CDP-diacylglycerol--inositol 3-phosphatidyltransferase